MESRTSNSIKNSTTSLISSLIIVFTTFISQTFFIKILGNEYLGVNGLFSNILSMLSLFELGFGNAIIYNMYKPIAKNDKEKVKSLMRFYKKIYIIIALIITCIGLCLLPFLKYIVNDISVNINIYYVYILMLASVIASYVLTYKRSILYAYQKNYIINIIHSLYYILLNFFQIFVLYITKNYYLFLVIKIIFQLFENIIINFVSNKKYKYINEKSMELSTAEKKNIFAKVKALAFHQIGSIIVFGTDNIIISRFLGVITVGLYSNYDLIIKGVNGLFSKVIASLTGSIGNLLVNDDKVKNYIVFDRIRFINFWISVFTSVSIFITIQPFIKIWLGKEYLLNEFTLIILVINAYQALQRTTYSTFKNSAGIWVEDKYVPLVESVSNIFFSVLFVNLVGLPGVFIGTFLSGLVLWGFSYPKYVYKKLFNRSYVMYFKETIIQFFSFVLISFISYCIYNFYIFDNIYFDFIKAIIISLLIPNLILLFFNYKTDNFVYIKHLINGIVKKFKL